MNKQKKIDKGKLEFRITQIRKLSFSENDPSVLSIKRKLPEAQINLNFGIKVDQDNELIAVQMRANFYVEHLKQVKDLFAISSEYSFTINKMIQLLPVDKHGRVKIPDSLMLTFLHITIGGTRGMIASNISSDAYKHLILPPLDPENILQGIKTHTPKDETPSEEVED